MHFSKEKYKRINEYKGEYIRVFDAWASGIEKAVSTSTTAWLCAAAAWHCVALRGDGDGAASSSLKRELR